MENTELPDRFMSTALVKPSGTVYEKFKLFQIALNVSQFLPDLYQRKPMVLSSF